MQQLELEFFWPLTEQIPLDLDFTKSDEFYRKQSVNAYGTLSGNVLTTDGVTAAWHSAPVATSFHIRPSTNYVGHWEVQGKDFQVYKEKKPSWLHRKFNETLIGWVWKDNK